MLFDKRISPSCQYCRHGKIIDNNSAVCIKRGIVDADSFCRRFKYDPLKRKPDPPLCFCASDFSEEDFSL